MSPCLPVACSGARNPFSRVIFGVQRGQQSSRSRGKGWLSQQWPEACHPGPRGRGGPPELGRSQGSTSGRKGPPCKPQGPAAGPRRFWGRGWHLSAGRLVKGGIVWPPYPLGQLGHQLGHPQSLGTGLPSEGSGNCVTVTAQVEWAWLRGPSAGALPGFWWPVSHSSQLSFLIVHCLWDSEARAPAGGLIPPPCDRETQGLIESTCPSSHPLTCDSHRKATGSQPLHALPPTGNTWSLPAVTCKTSLWNTNYHLVEWDLNSGLPPCKAGILSFALVILEMRVW
jgi:hypothetical protein